MEIQARQLVFHSAVVLVIGVLCGLPLTVAIDRPWPAEAEHLWHLAHHGLVFGAALGLAIAGILSSLNVQPARKSRVSWWFIVSNYAFCFSLVLGPIVGQRGLTPSLPWTNLVVLLGNAIGTFGGLIGAILLLHAARVSLAKGNTE